MKKLIFFVLFLSVCSIGVYAYFYWKATQIKTPVVSMDIIIPKKEAVKKAPVPRRVVPSKKTEPVLALPLKEKEEIVALPPKEIPENVVSSKEKQTETVQVEEVKTNILQKNTVSDTQEKNDIQDITPKNNEPEKVPAVVSDTLTDAVPLLVPTTEPIVKENASVVSQE